MGRNNNMNMNMGMSMSMGNTAFFGEMLTQERRNGSLSQIADNSMIEEEPSFLFEEDEVPDTPLQRDSYSSLLNFNANSTPNGITNHLPMTTASPMSPMFPYASHSEEKDNIIANTKNSYSHQLHQDMPQSGPSFTPLKPDRLIPEDLLGLIDDPLTPSLHKSSISLSLTSAEEKSMLTSNASPIAAKMEASTTNMISGEHVEAQKVENLKRKKRHPNQILWKLRQMIQLQPRHKQQMQTLKGVRKRRTNERTWI